MQFEEFPELFVGHIKVILVSLEAPCNFGIEVGYEEAQPGGRGSNVSEFPGDQFNILQSEDFPMLAE